MKKSDFNIADGEVPKLLKSAEYLRDNKGECCDLYGAYISCNNCPFDEVYYNLTKGCGTETDEDNGVKKAEQFIKLFKVG